MVRHSPQHGLGHCLQSHHIPNTPLRHPRVPAAAPAVGFERGLEDPTRLEAVASSMAGGCAITATNTPPASPM